MANRNTWREIARPIIAKVLADNVGKDEKEIRKVLKENYPFGQRSRYPYKVWRDEIKVQLKKKRFGKKSIISSKEQLNIFQ